MNIRLMFGLVIVCGMSLTSVFGMQGGDRNPRKRKELDPQKNVVDQWEQVRLERQARHRQLQQDRENQERQANEKQEELQRAKQAELEREQTQFNVLEDLISTLTMLINELEQAETFDVICEQLITIAKTVAQSGLDFAELKKSSNEVLTTKVTELFAVLQEIVTKIEANPIAQGACFNFESINDQLSMICQIVGYEGGIAVELKDMYTEEDERIARDEQRQLIIAADKELAQLMEDEVNRDRIDEDAELAFLLQQGTDAQIAADEADADFARRLQEEFNRNNS